MSFEHEVSHCSTLSSSFTHFLLLQSLPPSSQALNVLFDCHRNSPTPSLEGISPTIKYLEMLGNANIDIVLHYSKWVLEENPEGGLKVSWF